MSEELVLLEKSDSIATVTLNHPSRSRFVKHPRLFTEHLAFSTNSADRTRRQGTGNATLL